MYPHKTTHIGDLSDITDWLCQFLVTPIEAVDANLSKLCAGLPREMKRVDGPTCERMLHPVRVRALMTTLLSARRCLPPRALAIFGVWNITSICDFVRQSV